MPILTELASLLHRRLSVIADHAWRDRDAAGHLNALMEVSEEIGTWTREHRTEVDSQLRHYLANHSLQKALTHVETLLEESKGE